MYQLPTLRPEQIIIYLRKSRADDPSLSVSEVLAKHEQLLNDWCDRNLSGRIPEENRFREVVSGETINSRPEICKLLRLIESPHYKAILVVEPQRLSRGDLEDIGRLSKLLRYTNTLVITPQYAYDPTDARDRDDLERELKRGNEFLEYTKKILSSGRMIAKQNGNYLGNRPPYGYKKVSAREGRRTVHTLEPDEKEAPFVPVIFHLAAKGFGAAKICEELERLGAPPRQGTNWSKPSVRNILCNEHYLGLVVFKKHQEVKKVKDGEIVTVHTLPDNYETFPGKHPPLISEEEWNAVRQVTNRPKIKNSLEIVNPLAGILYCQCGYSMVYRPQVKVGNRSYRRYYCQVQTRCHTVSCSGEEMLEAVAENLQKAIDDFDIKISSGADEKARHRKETIQLLEAREKELDAQELRQWDSYTKGQMPAPIFDTLNNNLQAERESVRSALSAARADKDLHPDLRARRARFAEALALLRDEKVPGKQKNALLRSCISRIIYSRSSPDAPFTLQVELKA